MKFGVKNLGPIKEANVEIGDLTIICGKNNCGKTYLTYALYCFLKIVPQNYVFPFPKRCFDNCYKEGSCVIDSKDVFSIFCDHLSQAANRFIKDIPALLAMSQEISLDDTAVSIVLGEDELNCFIEKSLRWKFQVTEKCAVVVEKNEFSSDINIHLENTGERLPRKENLRKMFDVVCSLFFNKIFPDVFSLTGERSGISIFADNIADFSRKFAALEGQKIISATKFKRQIIANSSNVTQSFPLPVLKEIEFFQNLKKVRRKVGFIKKDFPTLLSFADKLAGGNYDFDDQLGVQYFPENTKTPLSLPESSSSVKSLVEFNFYLRHCAKKNQILMIDEPELNLHPANQRKMARLLAMLVNAGVKVFITTHSDYIIRELNTLIMLNDSTNPRLQQMAKDLKYATKDLKNTDGYCDCLLSPERVKCYVTKDGGITPMDISPKYGVEVTSFDDSIREFNDLQKRILYGE